MQSYPVLGRPVHIFGRGEQWFKYICCGRCGSSQKAPGNSGPFVTGGTSLVQGGVVVNGTAPRKSEGLYRYGAEPTGTAAESGARVWRINQSVRGRAARKNDRLATWVDNLKIQSDPAGIDNTAAAQIDGLRYAGSRNINDDDLRGLVRQKGHQSFERSREVAARSA